jgi:hypothetical protein
MAPWALTLAVANGAPTVARRGAAAALAIAPFVLCAVLRMIAFGHPAPLAVTAKPSDLTHGLVYGAAAVLVVLTPVLACAPVATLRAPRPARALVLAGAAHVAAVVVAGGDWMPYARLLVPVAPTLLYAFVLAAPHAHVVATAARATLAGALGLYGALGAAPAGQHVGAQYRAVIDATRPLLAPAHRIASLDVGWPTAANDAAAIVDLAGLTDPEIAALPGGHTSKRVDPALLLSRDPDVLLVFAEAGVTAATLDTWRSATYGRVVDQRFVRSDLIAEHYAPRAFVPFGDRGAGYVVLVRRSL